MGIYFPLFIHFKPDRTKEIYPSCCILPHLSKTHPTGNHAQKPHPKVPYYPLLQTPMHRKRRIRRITHQIPPPRPIFLLPIPKHLLILPFTPQSRPLTPQIPQPRKLESHMRHPKPRTPHPSPRLLLRIPPQHPLRSQVRRHFPGPDTRH